MGFDRRFQVDTFGLPRRDEIFQSDLQVLDHGGLSGNDLLGRLLFLDGLDDPADGEQPVQARRRQAFVAIAPLEVLGHGDHIFQQFLVDAEVRGRLRPIDGQCD